MEFFGKSTSSENDTVKRLSTLRGLPYRGSKKMSASAGTNPKVSFSVELSIYGGL